MPEVYHLLLGRFTRFDASVASSLPRYSQDLNEAEVICRVPGAYTPPLSMKVCRICVVFAFPALTSLRHVLGMQMS